MLNMCSGVALLLAKIDVFYPKEISHNPPTIMSNLSFLAAAEQIIYRTSMVAASAEQNRAVNRTERNRTEQNRTEQNGTEQNRTE